MGVSNSESVLVHIAMKHLYTGDLLLLTTLESEKRRA